MFESIENISLESLKLRLIFNQTEIYIYNASKGVAEYLRPLSKKRFNYGENRYFCPRNDRSYYAENLCS